jgi:carboxyl-terminal processing protease
MSASASEIITLALREMRSNVTVIGRQTFGKGTIQSLEPMNFGGTLKVTVGKRYSPK